TFFVVSGWVSTATVPWWDRQAGVRYPLMTWDEVRTLHRKGFDIGGHTRTHLDLGQIDDGAAWDEIAGGRRELEKELGAPVGLFAGRGDAVRRSSRHTTMLRNVGSNWALTLVTVAVTYVLTPFVIHVLGRDGYGTWTLITAVTGYVSLMALGVPTACVRFLAQHVAERDTRQMNATIGSCAGLYLMIGTAAAICGALSMA